MPIDEKLEGACHAYVTGKSCYDAIISTYGMESKAIQPNLCGALQAASQIICDSQQYHHIEERFLKEFGSRKCDSHSCCDMKIKDMILLIELERNNHDKT